MQRECRYFLNTISLAVQKCAAPSADSEAPTARKADQNGMNSCAKTTKYASTAHVVPGQQGFQAQSRSVAAFFLIKISSKMHRLGANASEDSRDRPFRAKQTNFARAISDRPLRARCAHQTDKTRMRRTHSFDIARQHSSTARPHWSTIAFHAKNRREFIPARVNLRHRKSHPTRTQRCPNLQACGSKVPGAKEAARTAYSELSPS